MSYSNKNTILIARRGYGNYEAVGAAQGPGWGGTPPTPPSTEPSTFSQVLGTIGGLFGTATSGINYYGQKQVTEQERLRLQQAQLLASQPRGGGTPGWVVPVAIGGGLLVLLLVLKKK